MSAAYLTITTSYNATGGVVTVPAFTIDSSDDALDDQTATCSFFWYLGQSYVGPIAGMNSLVIYHNQASTIGCTPSSVCSFWVDLRISNQGHIIPSNPTSTYNTVEIDRKIAAGLVSATGFPDPGSNGILARTAPNVATPRQIAAGSSNILVTNANGVSGNPTIDLASNVAVSASSPLSITAGNLSGLTASGSQAGFLSAADWTTFNGKQAALGFTAENIANKNQSGGYAGLTAGKLTASQGQEVWSVVDLTDYTGASGTGATALKTTITSPLNGQALIWDSASDNWINGTPAGGTVTSVAATVPTFLSVGGSPITGAGTLAITLSGTALPETSGGTGQITYTTGDILYASASNTLSKLAKGTNGQVLTMGASIPSWSGSSSGITTLNTLSGATQTFVTGTAGTDFAIVSASTTHTFNLPDYSATAKGLTTTGTQVAAGSKRFTGQMYLYPTSVPTDTVGRRLRIDDVLTSGDAGIFFSTANLSSVIGAGAGVGLHIITANTASVFQSWSINTVCVKQFADAGSYTVCDEASATDNTGIVPRFSVGSTAVFSYLGSYINTSSHGTAAFASTALAPINSGRGWYNAFLADGVTTDGNIITAMDTQSSGGGVANGFDTTRVAGGFTGGIIYGSNNHNLLTQKDSGGTQRTIFKLDNSNKLQLGYNGENWVEITNNAKLSGPGVQVNITQTQANASDTGDAALQLNYTLSGNVATNELVNRIFTLSATNSLIGGGVNTNLRLLDIATNTSASTTTANLSHIFLEAGATSGTVTTGRGLHISSIQGTIKWGIYDESTANWFLTGYIQYNGSLFANLGTPANGSEVFCADCDPPTAVNQACASVGTKTGAKALRRNGAWICY